jgi:hypothetical protein
MTRRPDADMMLDLVPEDGSFIGNGALLKALGWPEDKYWAVRDRLLEGGQLERGKGKGGSVRRCVTNGEQLAAKPIRNLPEAQLYAPIRQVLSNEWVREMRIEPDQIYFEITARQGKKATGGTWTRPDITAVSVRTFQHLPGKYFDVWTFEVKPIEALDVTAVFEAASHASRATRSYALLQIPEESSSGYGAEIIERCAREAARLRVGLITFSSESDFKTWETKVEAPRLETAPEALDEFIGHLSEAAKKRVAQWK